MTTTTKTKTERRDLSAGIDVFLGFQLRIKSLEYKSEAIRRLRADGEEIMEQLAALVPTGDVLRDGRVRAEWEEKLEAVFEEHSAALDRLGWELSH